MTKEQIAREMYKQYFGYKGIPDVVNLQEGFYELASWHIAEVEKLAEQLRPRLLECLPMGSCHQYVNEELNKILEENK